jgi:hypothetical protein
MLKRDDLNRTTVSGREVASFLLRVYADMGERVSMRFVTHLRITESIRARMQRSVASTLIADGLSKAHRS